MSRQLTKSQEKFQARKAEDQARREAVESEEDQLTRIALGMQSAQELIEEVQIPMEFAVALMTRRPELLPAARDMTAAEVAPLIDLIKVLFNTNLALQAHSRLVAQKMHNAFTNVRGSLNQLERASDLANFRVSQEADDERDTDGPY